MCESVANVNPMQMLTFVWCESGTHKCCVKTVWKWHHFSANDFHTSPPVKEFHTALLGSLVFAFFEFFLRAPKSRSEPFTLFKRPKTARGPNFNCWTITYCEKRVKNYRPLIYISGICGAHFLDLNRSFSSKGQTWLGDQISHLNSSWILRILEKLSERRIASL